MLLRRPRSRRNQRAQRPAARADGIGRLWHGASGVRRGAGAGPDRIRGLRRLARNPGAAAAIRAAMILGLVFVETLGSSRWSLSL